MSDYQWAVINAPFLSTTPRCTEISYVYIDGDVFEQSATFARAVTQCGLIGVILPSKPTLATPASKDAIEGVLSVVNALATFANQRGPSGPLAMTGNEKGLAQGPCPPGTPDGPVTPTGGRDGSPYTTVNWSESASNW